MNYSYKNIFSHNHHRGAAAITAILFFVIISTVFVLGISGPVVSNYTTTRDLGSSKGAYYLSESGLEDAVYRIKNGITIGASETLSLGGNTATTDITTVSPSQKTAASVGVVNTNTRRVGATLSTGAGEDFFYAMQVGAWGLFMGKDAIINGNVYSEGPICAGGIAPGDWGPLYNNCTTIPNDPYWPSYTTSNITGTVVSTGTTGSDGWITRVVNGGGNSMYAGTIANSTIAGSAYCNTIYNTTPSACSTLPSLPVQSFPLSDTDITAFEAAATAGGVDPCNSWDNKTISIDTAIGPWKYGCATLTFAGPPSGTPITITLQGPIWVTGYINFTGLVNVRVDPSFTGLSVPIIADKAGDNWFSRIILNNSGATTNFVGATGGNSWIALISTNNAIQSGDPTDTTNPAIGVGGGVSGDVILYAKDGLVKLEGSPDVAEVSGRGVFLKDYAELTYDMGLQDTIFHSGPGGAWETVDWKLGQ